MSNSGLKHAFVGPIQAVTFDVGGTILYPFPSIGEIYARIAARHGHTGLSIEMLTSRFELLWEQFSAFDHSREEWARLVDAVFDGLVPASPSATFFPELYAEFGRSSSWRIFDDVIPTLELLAASGVDLGIISNWDERLRPVLTGLRLDRYFNCVVISCEAGFAKPSPVVFGEALRQLGLPAQAVLHVGDSLREDFAGAVGAGLSALHLRRDAPMRGLQIRSLKDILRWTSAAAHAQPDRGGTRNFLTPDG